MLSAFRWWPFAPGPDPLPPEITIELPEAVKQILAGAIESAYRLGLLHGAIAGAVLVLILWFMKSK